jgi:hypothetical protein
MSYDNGIIVIIQKGSIPEQSDGSLGINGTIEVAGVVYKDGS